MKKKSFISENEEKSGAETRGTWDVPHPVMGRNRMGKLRSRAGRDGKVEKFGGTGRDEQ